MTNVLIQGSGGGGQKLAPLTTPATADKIKSGKEAYSDAGVKIIGTFDDTLPTLNAPTISVSGNVVTIVDGDNGTFSKTWEIYINNLPYRIIAHAGTYTFTELADGTYTVKVKARGDGFNDSAVSNVETMTISSSAPIYGVSGLYQSAPALTRTDDAVGMSWTMSNNEISSDFDSVFPYNEIVRTTIQTGDYESTFVKVPAIWWRVGYNASNFITDIAVSKSPMVAGANQIVYQSSEFYYGAYKSGGFSQKLYSISRTTPSSNSTRATYRTYATNNGAGFQLADLVHNRILEFLWLIEFATKQSEDVMWGATTVGAQTGATDNLTAPSGQIAAKGRMRYRYIEDFVGNGLEFFDGIAGFYVSANPSEYSDNMSATGIAYSIGGAGTPYDIAAFGIVDVNNPLLAPVVYTWYDNNYTTYFCDRITAPNEVFYRGRGSNLAREGLFAWQSYTAGTTGTIYPRLIYVPAA